MRCLSFPSLAAAEAHVRALGRGKAFASGGDLPLPRCDCGGLCPGDHSGSDVSRGARVDAACVCSDRAAPDAACPFVTSAAVGVWRRVSGGAYLVPVVVAHARGGVSAAAALDVDEPLESVSP